MNTNGLTEDERAALKRAAKVLQLLREADPDMTVGSAKVFLRVVLADDGITQAKLAPEIETSESSVNRIAGRLGCGTDYKGRPGRGLIAFEFDSWDGRCKPMRATAFGRFVAGRIEEAIEG